MSAPRSTPVSGEIWHLSIDDLFAALPVEPRLGGVGPFVINLSASTAPINLPPAGIAGDVNVFVYQIQRIEDHRPRYRLRLGPFDSEDEADSVLQKVRDVYPSALTATADAEDFRVIASMAAKATEQAARAAKTEAAALETTVAPPAVAAVMHAVAPTPAIVVAAAPAKVTIAAPPILKKLPISTQGPLTHAPAPRETHLPSMSTRERSLETTLTVRALTAFETEDRAALRWFVIQLSVAENPFDPETLPDLDIFAAYRLYSVAGIDQGRILHALRLGFFGEESAASAVSSYLAAYYPNTTIRRVSAAERERFANQRLAPRKDVGATGRHAVIEITDEPYVRDRPIARPIARVANAGALVARRSFFGKK